MMTSKANKIIGWSSFAIFAFGFCIWLSTRSIPTIDDSNDTGRYIEGFRQFCLGSEFNNDLVNKELSYNFFYYLLSPTCLGGFDGLFMFTVATFLPLTFLLFSNWNKGTALWAGAMLLSFYGLELMTNALRQSLAMLFFFGAISFLHRRLSVTYLLTTLSLVAHTSVILYLPLLLILGKFSPAGFLVKIAPSFIIIATLAVFIIYRQESPVYINHLTSLSVFYLAIYEENLNPLFVIFVTLPLYFIYGLRIFLDKKDITDGEKKAAIYSSVLILLCIFIFPAISFRFAVFSVSLQIFMVTISRNRGIRTGIYACFGMLSHLLIITYTSNNYYAFLK